MKKKRVAVMFGGNSTEYDVSLESAYAVLTHMNREKYDIFPVGITREGKWYHYSGDFENIRQDTWWKDEKHLAWAIVSQDPLFWRFSGFLRRRVEEGVGGSGLPGAAWQKRGGRNSAGAFYAGGYSGGGMRYPRLGSLHG